MASYKILSIDGGGIKGVLATSVLQRLHDEFGVDIKADLYAGTSTGGIISLLLAQGKLSVSEIGDMYLKRGHEIFKKNWWAPLTVTGAKYKNTALEKLLQGMLGSDTVLGDLPGGVLVSSFKLCDGDGWTPRFFTNVPAAGEDCMLKAVDVALCTSAAPTYFPSHNGHVDGGVAANNPTMCAIALAAKNGVPLKDIRVLSLGCGDFRPCIKGDINWGFARWGANLVPLFFGGLDRIPDYQARAILGDDHYLRINPRLTDDHGMDEPSWAPALQELGQHTILPTNTGAWIQECWQ